MGIKDRFLKAECSVLAATVMLSPLMLYRHLLYEYLMLSALTGKKAIELTPEQKAKVQELSNGLRKVFDTDKWPAQTAWEKAI